MRGSRAWRRAATWAGSSTIVLDAGEDLHRHAGRLGGPQRPLDQLGRRGGDGQQDLLDRVAGRRRPGCRRSPPTTGTPRSERPWARGVVVEDRDRDQAGPGAAQHLADGRGPGVAAADDRHPQAHPLGSPLPGEQPGVEPEDAHARRWRTCTRPPRRWAATRRIRERAPERPEGDQDAEGDRRRQQDLAGLLGAGVAPHPAVEAEEPVRR